MRRSISWLPGSGVSSSGRIVLTYGVIGRERQRDAGRAGAVPQRGEQPLDAAAIALLDDVVERFEPFPLFDCLELGGVTRRDVSHGGSSLLSQNFGITIPLL